MFQRLRYWLFNFFKFFGELTSSAQPKGWVEARLKYASGPKKGQVYKTFIGRNVVTSWLSTGGAAPTSGRDLMRRLLVPPGFPGSLSGSPGAYVGRIQVGSGTTAEVVTDDASSMTPLETKDIQSVTFDGSNPYVTFITEFDSSEANATISEAALLSSFDPDAVVRSDFIARKTFGAFTKTSDYTLEVRWTIKF